MLLDRLCQNKMDQERMFRPIFIVFASMVKLSPEYNRIYAPGIK